MLHAGLDLSRRKLDVCLLDQEGKHLDQLVCPPDGDGLRAFAARLEELHGGPVCAVIESMTGARFVHDTLEACGWEVEIADAQKVKGLAPLACKTDKIDSQVLATLSHRDLVPAIWQRTPGSGSLTALLDMRPGANNPISHDPPRRGGHRDMSVAPTSKPRRS